MPVKGPTFTIHTHASGEGGIFSNAYLVETQAGIVAVDTTLTMTESRTFRSEVDKLGKPLLAVLLTHAHPDHVAGATQLVAGTEAEIVALESVDRLMKAIEAPKRALWEPVFKDEWVPKWAYPTKLVKDGDAVTFDGATFTVHDFGAGGDCEANSVWVLETDPVVPFVGDLVFNGIHSYVTDGKLLAWIANLERARRLLAGVPTIYPGHGAPGPLDLFDAEQAYLIEYCLNVKELARGAKTLSDAAKQELVNRMLQYLPTKALSFLIPLGADAVAGELA